MSFKVHPFFYILIVSFALFLFFQLSEPPTNFPTEAWNVLGLLLLMASFWVTEKIPFAITALLPLIILPILGIGKISDLSNYYAHPVIFLFLGGFLIAIGLERTELHRRIALYIIKCTGRSLTGVLLGFITATALLSMWISNTATTVMMVAIAAPVIKIIVPKDDEINTRQKIGTFLLLGIAYAANIGGISTIIGTPPNAVLYALANESHSIHIGFVEWMIYALPIAVVMMALLFLLFYLSLKSINQKYNTHDLSIAVNDLLGQLKPLNTEQYIVLSSFSLSILLWLFRQPLNQIIGSEILSDPLIAMLGGILPFIIPSNIKSLKFSVEWVDTRDLPWSILILFGGGLSLAFAMETSGLIDWTANAIVNSAGKNALLLLFLLPALMLFMTEFMGNVAVVSVFLPLTFQIGILLGLPVTFFAYPVTIASSFAFMLPIATPPNAIVYSQGYFSINTMMKYGIWLNVIGIGVIFLFNYIYFLI